MAPNAWSLADKLKNLENNLLRVLIQPAKIEYSGNLDEGEDWVSRDLPLKEVDIRINEIYLQTKNWPPKLKYISGILLFEEKEVLVPFYCEYYKIITPAWSAFSIISKIKEFRTPSKGNFFIDDYSIEKVFYPYENCQERKEGVYYNKDLYSIIIESGNGKQHLLEGCASGFKRL